MLSHSFAAVRLSTDLGAMSTTSRWAPAFRTSSTLDAGATNATRAGETASATGSRPVSTAAGEEEAVAAKAVTTGSANVSLTAQSR
jgi:hypothetical protein